MSNPSRGVDSWVLTAISTLVIPPNRGDIVYEETLCHTHDASSTRSSGPVLCGLSGRREGRSLRSPRKLKPDQAWGALPILIRL